MTNSLAFAIGSQAGRNVVVAKGSRGLRYV
jgi:hypothetical protein